MTYERKRRGLGSVLLILSLSLVTPSEAAPAEDARIWVRTRPGQRTEMALRGALNRTLQGYGDDRDLARIRTALVGLGRKEGPRDPGNVVLLVRFRLELGLPQTTPATAASWIPALAAALAQPSALGIQAIGWFDLARLQRVAGQKATDVAIEEALRVALDPEQRAQALFLRGLMNLERHELEEAGQDFSAAGGLTTRSSSGALALTGLALSQAMRGSVPQAELSSTAAARMLSEAARASGLALTHGWTLDATEEAYFQAILAHGEWVASRSSASSSERACHAAQIAAASPVSALSSANAWLDQACASPDASSLKALE